MSLPTDSMKEVVPDDNKQFALNTGGLEVVAYEPPPPGSEVHSYNAQVHQPMKKKRFQVIGLLALVIILAAVLGSVLGSRHTASTTAASPKPPSNSSATPSVSKPGQRNIAALSFPTKTENNTRVYFQDNEGQIMEAVNLASNGTWRLSKTGYSGKNGSAIAAAVSPPGFPLAGELDLISPRSC